MPSLRAKQLLLEAARLSQAKEESISRKEINKKINQIKYLASQPNISKDTLKKEITHLEKRLQGIFALEKRLKGKEKEEKEQIASLKKQIKELKTQLTHTKDLSLRKKISKISFLIGELVAKSEIKKEAEVQEALQRIVKKKKIAFPPAGPPEETLSSEPFTLKKVNELQEKIISLKMSGQVPPEKIAELEQRLTELEKKLPPPADLPSEEETDIQHQMLFGPSSPETLSSTQEAEELEKEIDELPVPPPPLIKKKK